MNFVEKLKNPESLSHFIFNQSVKSVSLEKVDEKISYDKYPNDPPNTNPRKKLVNLYNFNNKKPPEKPDIIDTLFLIKHSFLPIFSKIYAKLFIHISFSFSAGKIEQHQLFSAFDFSTVANFFVFLSEVCVTEKSPA